jgi:ABC-2 type transport system ATP-binding protein
LALSFNPELIILDEPTSGLDPIVRRDFIENIVAEIGEEGKTVLFSSHIVEEVERVADYVGIINDGELLMTSSLEEIKSSYKRVRCAANGARPELAGVPGVLAVENGRHEQVLTVEGWGEELLGALRERGVRDPELLPISLEDIFVNTVRAERERRAAL